MNTLTRGVHKCDKCGGFIERVYRDESRCLICGKRFFGKRDVLKFDRTPPKEPRTTERESEPKYKPCPVIGCNKMMRIDSPHVMCGDCNKILNRWNVGMKTTPPPIVEIDGAWTFNPERSRRK